MKFNIAFSRFAGGKSPIDWSLRLMFLVGLILTSCGTPATVYDQPLEYDFRVLSLNIHYLVPGRDRTGWEERKPAVSAALNELSSDIVMFQEMETFRIENFDQAATGENIQLDWVLATVEGYEAAAVGEVALFPITQPILYRPDRFTLLDQGFFYFSDTPDVPYSGPWDGRWPSYTTWVLLEERESAFPVLVLNTHLDAFSRMNREKGMNLILNRLSSIPQALPEESRSNLRVVIGGDFNMLASNRFLGQLGEAGYLHSRMRGSSFHFRWGLHLYPAIDHFYHSSGLETVAATIHQRQWEGQWPSDHHIITADYRFNF